MGLQGICQTKSEASIKESSESAELLMYHTRMGHIGFGKLREMSKQGIIPSYLPHVPTPACLACMFGKASRSPSRHKPRREWSRKEVTCLGEVVSVAQMVSPNPGLVAQMSGPELVAQMSGRPTKDRYKYATVYVDNYSGYSYIHLQKTHSVTETVESKHTFETFCKQHGVKVRGYHADNGIFKAKDWINDCRAKQQSLIFTGVNAHHRNGRAERRIGLLQDLSWSMLIYADRRWRGGAVIYLWPYAMRMSNESVNNCPKMQDKFKRAPIDIMFNTQVQMNIKHWHPFACPAYVLDIKLQDEKRIYNKWKSRSRVGMYLGHSPLPLENSPWLATRMLLKRCKVVVWKTSVFLE